jgi:phosphate transport system substrate-binding protein
MPRLLRLTLVLPVALSLLAVACGGGDSNSPSKATITISGAFALYPMVVQWTEEYHRLHSDVEFDVSGGGAGKGMSDVLAGAVDVAMVSREIRQEETDRGAVGVAVVKDAVVATVNANNPVLDQLLSAGLTPVAGARIWISTEITTWGQLVSTDNADPINVYTRADASGAGEMWARFLGGQVQEDLQQGKSTAVQGDPGLAEAVRQDRLGIGYNNIGFAYDLTTGQPVDGLSVVPLDLNGDGTVSPDESFYSDKASLTAAIAEGRYPSPPARPLYLVTKGQPKGAAADFIRWTLTDGQKFVSDAGYVLLTAEQVQASLAVLDQK